MRRSLSSYPLHPGLLAKLTEAGFETTLDLDGVGPVELAKGEPSL